MFTRKLVRHQYGHPGHADYSAPPFHVVMHPHQYPAHAPSMGRACGQGGLSGGAVQLHYSGNTGSRGAGGTGYGFLGLDPSDPATWIRPFNPAPGMIAYLNGVVR